MSTMYLCKMCETVKSRKDYGIVHDMCLSCWEKAGVVAIHICDYCTKQVRGEGKELPHELGFKQWGSAIVCEPCSEKVDNFLKSQGKQGFKFL